VKIERVIEEFNQLDEYLNREYILNISPEEILATLDDLVLSKDDFPHEIYNCYDLNENQIQKFNEVTIKGWVSTSKYNKYVSILKSNGFNETLVSYCDAKKDNSVDFRITFSK
jgi:hypothetical protein